jgi:hypothetical protein
MSGNPPEAPEQPQPFHWALNSLATHIHCFCPDGSHHTLTKNIRSNPVEVTMTP